MVVFFPHYRAPSVHGRARVSAVNDPSPSRPTLPRINRQSTVEQQVADLARQRRTPRPSAP
eukprot:6807826-Pyramimonas_sp.AAC.1